MVKKRNRDPEMLADASPAQKEEDHDSDDEMEIVNVDFEWFNFKPKIDFHGIRTLLRQLLDVDSSLFELSALTDLVLSQPTVGSTVKVDGEETDAYATLTILNLNEHNDKEVIKNLTQYLVEKSRSIEGLTNLGSILASSAQVGLILSERLINVPAQIAPPMYRMLIDEVEAAVEDNEPYKFTHYLILSKTYQEIASALNQDTPRIKKKKATQITREKFYFHPEDEIIQEHALGFGSFEYTNDQGEGMADSKRAFSDVGIKPQGLMVLIEAGNFEGAVEAINEYLNPQ